MPLIVSVSLSMNVTTLGMPSIVLVSFWGYIKPCTLYLWVDLENIVKGEFVLSLAND